MTNLDQRYVTPFWQSIHQYMERKMGNNIPSDFLKDEWIAGTMSSSNIDVAKIQFNSLMLCFEGDVSFLKYLLEEWPYGNPVIHDFNYCGIRTSCNAVHHLYHIQCFIDQSLGRTNVEKINSIVEFGGGYGRFACLMYKIFPNLKNYTIIDLPFFNRLQDHYISSVFQENWRVNLLSINSLDTLTYPLLYKNEDGKMVACDAVESTLPCDLFIAMWSLSEATPACYQEILKGKFFNSKYQFMGFHKYPQAEMPVGNMLFEYCSKNMKVVPNNAGTDQVYAWN